MCIYSTLLVAIIPCSTTNDNNTPHTMYMLPAPTLQATQSLCGEYSAHQAPTTEAANACDLPAHAGLPRADSSHCHHWSSQHRRQHQTKVPLPQLHQVCTPLCRLPFERYYGKTALTKLHFSWTHFTVEVMHSQCSAHSLIWTVLHTGYNTYMEASNFRTMKCLLSLVAIASSPGFLLHLHMNWVSKSQIC